MVIRSVRQITTLHIVLVLIYPPSYTVQKGGLDNKQMIAPYWLYPVKVTNELTNLLKEKKPGGGKGDEEAEAGEGRFMTTKLDGTTIS